VRTLASVLPVVLLIGCIDFAVLNDQWLATHDGGGNGGGTQAVGGGSAGVGGGTGGGTAVLLDGGAPCTSGSQCGSTLCVDGVCCNSSCTGQCEACDVTGHLGTCSAVTGSPEGPRNPCQGVGTCGGVCNGTSTTSCQYPQGTICGGTCDGTCNGQGSCSGTSGACPNGYACASGGTCLASCTAATDCQPQRYCDAGACVRIAESNCLDGMDNNGDGLIDCADPTCIGSQVICVPQVGAGATLGVLLDGGSSCPSNYPTSKTLHGNLQPKACLGCTCQTGCTSTMNLYASTDCSGSVSWSTTFYTSSPSTAQCNTIPQATRDSAIISSTSVYGCTSMGSASQASPTWGTDKLFCDAKTSDSCGSGFICVPKPPSAASVIVDSASACPTGYDGGENVYYQSFTAGGCGACGSAGCTPATALTCSAFLPTAGTLQCGQSGSAAALIGTSCSSIGPSRNPVAQANCSWTTSGTDNCVSTPTRTDPQPSGGQRVCTVR
jgi:hypothetical protein